MMLRLKMLIGRAISPIAVLFLKIYTRITGAERARVIITNDFDEILLVRGFVVPKWSLPGGGIERGESPVEAAQREVWEETGIDVDVKDLREVAIFKGDVSPVNYVAHIFTINIPADALPEKQYNTSEIIDLAWHPLNHLPTDLSSLVRPSLNLLSKTPRV